VIVRKGITRIVFVGRRWAIKMPRRYDSRFWLWWVRGWLANQSEWRQRDRPDVARPVFTLFHIALVFPAAIEVGNDKIEGGRIVGGPGPWLTFEERCLSFEERDDHADEMKPSSWGRFADGWKIIDFDRAWHSNHRSLAGKLYYERQERMARRWINAG
jgi:hypothetical protein